MINHQNIVLICLFVITFPSHCSLLVDSLRKYDISWEKIGPFNFIKNLKTVTIEHFGKYYCNVEFARFLVLNSRVLNKMTLLCSERLTKKWIGMMSHRLCLDYKASSELEVIFFKDSYDNANFILWNSLIEAF